MSKRNTYRKRVNRALGVRRGIFPQVNTRYANAPTPTHLPLRNRPERGTLTLQIGGTGTQRPTGNFRIERVLRDTAYGLPVMYRFEQARMEQERIRQNRLEQEQIQQNRLQYEQIQTRLEEMRQRIRAAAEDAGETNTD